MQEPLGIGGERLHEWVFPLQVWLRAHGKQGGEVNESVDHVDDLHGLELIETVAAPNVVHLKLARQ